MDDALGATIDLHASSPEPRRIVYSWASDVSAAHTLKVVCVGTAGHSRIGVDAFILMS